MPEFKKGVFGLGILPLNGGGLGMDNTSKLKGVLRNITKAKTNLEDAKRDLSILNFGSESGELDRIMYTLSDISDGLSAKLRGYYRG